jgi:methylated-DNA-[protein]-cysteine S-methyltransferase
MTMTAVFDVVDTPDGPFAILAAADGAVLSSGWTDSVERIVERIRLADRPADIRPGTTDAAAAVRAYYAGDLAAIDEVSVRQFGTPGQMAGWAALRRIAPGAPLSYATFAAALGHPTALRAAASVCARNAPALFVPCHRVLRTDGSLGGFAWGLEVKRSLLDRENPSLLSADSQA